MKSNYSRLAVLALCAILCTGCGKGGDAKDPSEEVTESANSTEALLEEALDFHAADYVKLGEYKNLKVQYPLPSVSGEDVQTYVEELVSDNTEYNKVDRPAAAGDYVNIDFTGTVDGKEFEGGSAAGYELTLGEGEFLEDFEKNITGKGAGESVTFDMVFPEDYDEEMAGKTAQFTVKINSVSEVVTPEYTDELVAKATEYTSMEEYEEAMREELMEEAQQESMNEAASGALAQAIKNASIDGYPQPLYDYYYRDNQSTYESYAEMFGMDFDTFMEDFMDGETLDSLTVDSVNEFLVCQAIADAEGLTILEEDFQKEAEEMAANFGYDSLEDFELDYEKEEIRMLLIRENVLNFLYEAAEIEEVSQEEYYGEDEELEGETETEM